MKEDNTTQIELLDKKIESGLSAMQSYMAQQQKEIIELKEALNKLISVK